MSNSIPVLNGDVITYPGIKLETGCDFWIGFCWPDDIVQPGAPFANMV